MQETTQSIFFPIWTTNDDSKIFSKPENRQQDDVIVGNLVNEVPDSKYLRIMIRKEKSSIEIPRSQHTFMQIQT